MSVFEFGKQQNLWSIGVAGSAGFGVGVCSDRYLPTGFTPLAGCETPTSSNYGNYQHESGGVFCFVPKFWYKVGTGTNGLAVNVVDVKGIDTFANTTEANAADYALHRAFIDGGVEIPGFMYAKYKSSKVAWGAGHIAASVKNGLPISMHADHNPIADLTACDINNYFEAINAAHAVDGVDGAVNASSIFHVASMFQGAALWLLSIAHGQASGGTANCAWYDATNNFPKGCNNNALRDTDDASVLYTTDGYSNCGKTGSGVIFAKTTHNGQDCGIADLNGLMYEIRLGVTCEAVTAAIESMSQAAACELGWTNHGLETGDIIMISGITQADWDGAKDKLWSITKTGDHAFTIPFNSSGFGTPYDAGTDPGTVTKGVFYVAQEATRMADFTAGNSLATDHWGATGVAAMMQAFTPPFLTTGGQGFSQRFGNGANQVFSEALSGPGWLLTGLGMPKDSGGLSVAGSALMGNDYFYQYVRHQLCLLACAYWTSYTSAGPGALNWSIYRTSSSNFVGVRLACACNPG